MIFVESPHGPGVVGFVGGELARYHSFTAAWTALNVPPGTRGHSGLGYDVAYNRNAVIDYALNGCMRCGKLHRGKDRPGCAGFVESDAQWVQLWDDDHVFAPDTLLRLLDHNVDVVAPFYRQRQPQYRPCIYKERMPDGSHAIFLDTDLEGKDGLIPISSAGAGGVLIRRRVLEAIANPWFERQGLIGEDHMFFSKCADAGFQPYCALDVPLGHTSTYVVWPVRNERGAWGARVDLQGEAPNLVEFWDAKYRG